jgi:hypothetical protein
VTTQSRISANATPAERAAAENSREDFRGLLTSAGELFLDINLEFSSGWSLIRPSTQGTVGPALHRSPVTLREPPLTSREAGIARRSKFHHRAISLDTTHG